MYAHGYEHEQEYTGCCYDIFIMEYAWRRRKKRWTRNNRKKQHTAYFPLVYSRCITFRLDFLYTHLLPSRILFRTILRVLKISYSYHSTEFTHAHILLLLLFVRHERLRYTRNAEHFIWKIEYVKPFDFRQQFTQSKSTLILNWMTVNSKALPLCLNWFFSGIT